MYDDIWTTDEPFRPIVDGVILKDQPLNLFRNGLWQNRKEMIIGTATEEMAVINIDCDISGICIDFAEFKVIRNIYIHRVTKLIC